MTQNNDDTNFLPEDTDLFAAAQEAAPQAAGAQGADPQQSAPETVQTQNELPQDKQPQPQQRTGLPRWVWWVLGAVVVIGGTVGALAGAGVFQAEPEPLPTPTVTLDPPTPTATPITPAEDASALVQALPASSLQYVLAAVTASETWSELAPIEQWDAVYDDGSGASFTVSFGQWADDAAATTAARTIASDIEGEVFSEGGVVVNGEEVGTHQVFNNAVVWRNGTVVLVATGPQQDLVNFYTAFGL